MKAIRIILFAGVLALVLAGCSALNALVPEVDLDAGAFGLDAGGSELTSAFSDSSSLVTLAVSTFARSGKFADLSDDRVTGIQTLATKLGLAAYQNDIIMYLTKPTNGYPESITLNSFTLDMNISDATGSVTTPPSGDPLTISPNLVVTKDAACSAEAAECGYKATAADALELLKFAVSFSGQPATDLYKVIGSGGENTFSVSLTMDVSNSAAELAGATVRLKVSESETKIKVAAF